MMWGALISESRAWLIARMAQKKFAEMRFTDASLTAYESDVTLTALGLVPKRQQMLQFLAAAHKSCNLV